VEIAEREFFARRLDPVSYYRDQGDGPSQRDHSTGLGDPETNGNHEQDRKALKGGKQRQGSGKKKDQGRDDLAAFHPSIIGSPQYRRGGF
jgi:hypothetical protein